MIMGYLARILRKVPGARLAFNFLKRILLRIVRLDLVQPIEALRIQLRNNAIELAELKSRFDRGLVHPAEFKELIGKLSDFEERVSEVGMTREAFERQSTDAINVSIR